MYDVIALGELLVDLAERAKDENGYPTLAANPGGAPGNFLAALSAYGKKTAFLAKVGDDTFGHLLPGTPRRDRHARHSDQPRNIHDACVRDL